ncbi:MAG: hypothetical protein QJR08_00230 [Bacillota bacterium]|nr:hypothetical protein [Bacillota bacterium]
MADIMTAAPAARGRRRFTDSDILNALRAAYQETGRVPTVASWRAEGRSPSPMSIFVRFGSWSEALRMAGLPVSGRSAGIPVRRARTRERHLAILREVGASHGGPITMKRWDTEGIRPAAHTIVIRFRGWRRAWEAAGFAWRREGRDRISDDEILARMREATARAGRALTVKEWDRAGLLPSASTIARRFGSWPAAWRAAGVGHPRDSSARLEAARARLKAGGLTAAERRALEAVIATGSESAAAQRLGVTRQAVSFAVLRALRRPAPAA